MNDSKRREDILYAFAVEPIHDQATLARYLGQYPELAEELVDLSFEFRVTESMSHVPKETRSEQPDPGGKLAWQQFIAVKPTQVTSPISDSPFAFFKGQAFVELAASLKLPRSILTALRDRLVDPLSIPDRFVQRFAKATESAVAAVREYFSREPVILGSAEFKADKKPAPQNRVRFETLVANTNMTDEQRKYLLQDFDADGLD